MQVEELRHYGKAFSDIESSWPEELKRWMKKVGRETVFRSLGPVEKILLVLRLAIEKRQNAAVDLSDFHKRGMTNEPFIRTQREFVSLYSALSKTVGSDRALKTLKGVMDKTALKALALCFPPPEDMRTFDDPLETFKVCTRAAIEPARKAGCHTIEIVEDRKDSFRYDITSCVWHQLAECFGAPEACLINCYADDIFLPGYFEAFGLTYRRETTLARGGPSCDFRLTRKTEP